MPNGNLTVLRLLDVIQKTGLSRSTIYLYMKNNKFPSPISLGERSIGWLENEIHEWIESRIEISRD